MSKVQRFSFQKSDGRWFHQYHLQGRPEPKLLDEGLVRPASWQAPTLRLNAMRGEWVAIASSRNDRPFLPPKEYCPLCPQKSFVKDPHGQLCKTDVPIMDQEYDWAVFENMFPGLSAGHDTGHCEVILYAKEHHKTLASCSTKHLEGLVQVWQDRSRAVGQLDHIKQVFIFENKGTEVGVTLHHPHGQLYAFNHRPPFLEREDQVSRAHHQKTGRCLVCDLAHAEQKSASRVVAQVGSLIAYVPEAARYPYEVHITTLTHRPLIEQLEPSECRDLAVLLKTILAKYNLLLNIEFPYLMVHHQASHDEPAAAHYHWHIEFYPPYRAAGKLKYLAGVESGAGLFINDTVPEQKAAELRALAVNLED